MIDKLNKNNAANYDDPNGNLTKLIYNRDDIIKNLNDQPETEVNSCKN